MTGPVTIASIVEGDGEVSALPVLLRRIAGALSCWDVRIPPPRRVPRSRLVARGGVENAVLQASYQLTGAGGILLLIDSDDDCPATLGPELLRRAREARGDREISVVLACREFEAWFLAAAESLSGHRGLADPLLPPPNPEGIRGAKEWLSARSPTARGTGRPWTRRHWPRSSTWSRPVRRRRPSTSSGVTSNGCCWAAEHLGR
ncbi:DUF4276 family protein [Streptosporangium saharense]|uniref:DUF4276 family protein n=1 Tax=Streptosporangium saharense TaxID=1706840 RepID=UPI003440B829